MAKYVNVNTHRHTTCDIHPSKVLCFSLSSVDVFDFSRRTNEGGGDEKGTKILVVIDIKRRREEEERGFKHTQNGRRKKNFVCGLVAVCLAK